MVRVDANNVRIPPAAKEALARDEKVVVLHHGRPAYTIARYTEPPSLPSQARRPYRTVREIFEALATVPWPDPEFAADLEAVLESVGETPRDPWEQS
ncbi:MAG: hypothetical protein J2P45_23795 [Candidatus Dormibacteraeota bacterium]|nr:hypothetical protein [Candidatus Dormibacteraeota bacterium]